jgi:hypothetical protein
VSGRLDVAGRLNQAQDKFLVAYEAVQVSAKFEVKSFDPAREDTGWNLAAAKGIETAMRDFGGTSRPYNIAVLPEVIIAAAKIRVGFASLAGSLERDKLRATFLSRRAVGSRLVPGKSVSSSNSS